MPPSLPAPPRITSSSIISSSSSARFFLTSGSSACSRLAFLRAFSLGYLVMANSSTSTSFFLNFLVSGSLPPIMSSSSSLPPPSQSTSSSSPPRKNESSNPPPPSPAPPSSSSASSSSSSSESPFFFFFFVVSFFASFAFSSFPFPLTFSSFVSLPSTTPSFLAAYFASLFSFCSRSCFSQVVSALTLPSAFLFCMRAPNSSSPAWNVTSMSPPLDLFTPLFP
mmetsp:Transcript_24902/g.61358  ORF Transcript_24902/g.61358 Transcript_24902/m.61358 type:complete len:223 (-) Transcript_24902:114-782(-)